MKASFLSVYCSLFSCRLVALISDFIEGLKEGGEREKVRERHFSAMVSSVWIIFKRIRPVFRREEMKEEVKKRRRRGGHVK